MAAINIFLQMADKLDAAKDASLACIQQWIRDAGLWERQFSVAISTRSQT